MTHPLIERLLTDLLAGCHRQYGSRLAVVAVFGSIGRGPARPDSDLDVLVVADGLPDGRREFRDRYPPPVAERIERLAQISSWLRKEREFAFTAISISSRPSGTHVPTLPGPSRMPRSLSARRRPSSESATEDRPDMIVGWHGRI